MRIGDIGAVKLTLRELRAAIALRRHSKRLGQWVADRRAGSASEAYR